MTTTRARLQELSLANLRKMAGEVDVDHDGLQKSKLIAEILEAEKFDEKMLPEPSSNGDSDGEPKAEARQSGAQRQGGQGGRGQGQGQRQGQGQGEGRRRRRRGGGRPQEPIDESELEVREGILDILPEGYGFLRCTGYLPGDKDVYVPANLVRKNRLRKGDIVSGPVRPARGQEKFPALYRPATVNGMDPEEAAKRPKFSDLTPLFPDQRLRLEVEGMGGNLTARIMDLISPIGKGQRGLIVSPPKAGKTTVLKDIANSITANNPECYLMVVLVDERPEEVTDMQRSVKGEVVYSTFDRPAEEHTQVSELAIERAKRLVEAGTDVVIVLDSITRLARAHNLATPASGRILSGGVDSTALYPPKRFFGAARNIEEGGSLTIMATALVDTGSRMDEVIFEEFKGTGNMELRLDRKLADKRIYPAIDIEQSGTRKEELLFSPDELTEVWKLRRVLLALEPGASLELLIDRLRSTKSNAEFLASVAKSGQ
ncbi:MAG: transcription termination factor Rho [Acidimicrobiia bacterium]|nr:MAG: transcription termination factor Rho [Acidimicrobiia bacterium]